MDRATLVGLDRSLLVDRAAQYVHDAAERRRPDRHGNRFSRARHLHAAAQSVGAAEGDTAHDAVSQLLLDFERQSFFNETAAAGTLEHQRVVYSRHRIAWKFHVDDGADALNNGSLAHIRFLDSLRSVIPCNLSICHLEQREGPAVHRQQQVPRRVRSSE